MAKAKRKAAAGDVATNRQASFRYELLDRVEAGLQLQGSEVKSLRDGGAQLREAYATISKGEVWLHGAHIPPYKPAARDNHEPERARKLLMHRGQIERLTQQTKERGFTLVPTRMYFKDGRAKVEVALARGKDLYDKRQSLKEKDLRREMSRALSER